MNRKAFYAQLRKRNSGVFGTSLTQGQVEGMEALLTAGQYLPLAHLAHVLAEVFHETGAKMMPVRETFARSDDEAIDRLERAWRRGQLTWVTKPYWRKDKDGKTWLGRGAIQITHPENYQKATKLTGVDLVSNPNAALQINVSAKIAVEGCRTGMFTGKKLSDFDRATVGYDHFNARSIVNGDKGAMGKHMEAYGRAFERALEAAAYKPAEPLKEAPDSPAERRKWWQVWRR